jgi:hypothetical protein
MICAPKFVSSPYFYVTDTVDPETQSYWRLKPGAPPDIQKSFDEWKAAKIYAVQHNIDR